MSYFLFNEENIFNLIKKIVFEKKIKLKFKNFIFYKILMNSGIHDLSNHIFINKKFRNKLNENLNKKFRLSIVNIDPKKKNINLDNNFWKKYIKFIILSLFYIFKIFLSLIKVNIKTNKDLNIIYGPTSRVKNLNQNTLNFFFNENKLLFNFKKSIVIFKHNENKILKNIIFDKDPLFYICENYLKKKDRIVIAISILKNIFYSFYQLYKSKLSIIVYEEINQLILYQKIAQKKIINNIFSYYTANASSYPVWNFIKCKQIKKYLIMDSVNDFYPISIENLDPKTTDKSSSLKILKYLNFDNLIAPDLITKKILQSHTNSKIIVNKKVFFNFNDKSVQLANKYNICIFDSNSTNFNYTGFLEDDQNYIKRLSFENILIFIEDILKVVEKINLKLNIKINCYIKSKHSSIYKKSIKQKSIRRLKRKYNFFYVLDDDTNLEKLFHKFKTVISIPFTSPSHFFSVNTKRRSIYYDNLNMIKKNHLFKKILLINNKKNLEKNIIKLLNVKK